MGGGCGGANRAALKQCCRGHVGRTVLVQLRMTSLSDKLEQIIASYFADLRDKRGLGAGTPERSYYPAVAKLLDAIGQQLKPIVLCLSDLGNTGAGQPDFGLYVAHQVQKGEPRKGQMPERGVIEMKPVKDDAWLTADTKQVSKYWQGYGLVIVTNLRDFLILGRDAAQKSHETRKLSPRQKRTCLLGNGEDAPKICQAGGTCLWRVSQTRLSAICTAQGHGTLHRCLAHIRPRCAATRRGDLQAVFLSLQAFDLPWKRRLA